MRRIKQILALILITALACLILFTGCSKKELVNNTYTGEILASERPDAPVDGTYTALSKYYNPRGYGQKLTITVYKGIITKTSFSEINAQGVNRLSAPNPKVGWTETNLSLKAIYGNLYADFMGKQSPAIDTVSGATQTSDNFKILAEAALISAKAANTIPIIVNDFVWTYTAQSTIDEITGYQAKLSITFDKDVITQVVYDEYKADNSISGSISEKSAYNNFSKETQLKQNLEALPLDPNFPMETARYNDLLQKIATQRVPFNSV